ncbi:MAG: hypothetical protein JST54_24515 [Deltaproteobacteria bacterium]|nr:hypothetical protein [Deltaproteobacteria bacterium]
MVSDSLPLERIWRRVLERRLRAKLGARVSLSIHDNTHTMISFQRRRGEYRLRLHHMFLAASEPLVAALVEYVKGGDEEASAKLDKFIQQNRVYIRRVSSAELRARVPIEPAGDVHHLQEIYDELNRRFFRGQVKASITYARVPRVTKVRRSIKLGSYSSESKVIRIHPALDQRGVPSYFVEWVVFHEMLHHLSPAVMREGKRCVHTPEFNQRERRFPLFHRARRWEQRNLDYLLRYRVRR